MSKKHPAQEPTPAVTEIATVPPVVEAPKHEPEPVDPPKTGLALLKSEYADRVTGEPTPLKWRAQEVTDHCGIVSKYGTLLYPDGTTASFTHAEVLEVRRYLSALRPLDEIQITNL
jgi:hypothetical protein